MLVLSTAEKIWAGIMGAVIVGLILMNPAGTKAAGGAATGFTTGTVDALYGKG